MRIPITAEADKPTIIHQSSATGMQAIPATGIAQGIAFKEQAGMTEPGSRCALFFRRRQHQEGEVSEAFQFAVLKKLPIIYLVQDNGWGISVTAAESRSMDASVMPVVFTAWRGLRLTEQISNSRSYCMQQVFEYVRKYARPYLVQARVPLLTHHTSGVRMETYRTEGIWRNTAHWIRCTR